MHLLWRWVLPTRRSVQTACWAQWTSDTAWSRPVSWCLQARNTSFSPRTCLCSWCLLQVSFAKHCLSSFDPVASCIQYYIIRYHDIMRMCARCQLSRGVDSCCQPCACFLSSLVISRFPLGWLLQAGHKLFWFFGDSRIGLSYLGRWVAKDVWEALGQWNQRLGFVEISQTLNDIQWSHGDQKTAHNVLTVPKDSRPWQKSQGSHQIST